MIDFFLTAMNRGEPDQLICLGKVDKPDVEAVFGNSGHVGTYTVKGSIHTRSTVLGMV